MPKTDKRVDAYIAKSADFAKPILMHIRELVHKAVPGIEETMKWSFPHFVYAGGTVCSMASFKEHCALGFWKASLLSDPDGILQTSEKNAMGHLGKILGLEYLPKDRILLKYLKEAAELNAKGIKAPSKPKAAGKKELEVPGYFMKELKKNKKALKTFENFSYTNKKEYVDWVTGAKTEETRINRMATAIEWMAEGKIRHWKYIKC
jgi:uncharacterized protein YdeI (YjbR/CyaY-like superfamily)